MAVCFLVIANRLPYLLSEAFLLSSFFFFIHTSILQQIQKFYLKRSATVFCFNRDRFAHCIGMLH